MPQKQRARISSMNTKYGLFLDKLTMILLRAEADPELKDKTIRVGALASALSVLLTDIEEVQRYGRAYRYMKQARPYIEALGWEMYSVGGFWNVRPNCLALKLKDYSKCDYCDRRIECLGKPLMF